jgi:multidrug efflux system membrane fusion protein
MIAVASGLGGLHLSDPEVLPRLASRLLPAAPAAKVAPPRVVPVTAQRVRQEEMELFLNGLGSVVAFNTVTIRSRVEGELVRVAFSEGQVVNQGDLLAEIDPRPYEVQLTQAEGQLARDQAALQAATLDLARYEALAAQKQITGQQIDSQRALVRQAEAALQIDRGMIDNVKLQLSYCRITAPITGRIGLRLVDPGNIVRGNEPAGLAVIAQLQPIGVVFTIPQDEIGRVQQALAAGGTMAVEAFNRDFHTQLATGTLAALDNQVDASTGTVKIKAVFPNEDGMLFPNQFVNARLLVETLRGALVVPLNALLQHRGHALLTAGRSIAVQNFNENLRVLLMLRLEEFDGVDDGWRGEEPGVERLLVGEHGERLDGLCGAQQCEVVGHAARHRGGAHRRRVGSRRRDGNLARLLLAARRDDRRCRHDRAAQDE